MSINFHPDNISAMNSGVREVLESKEPEDQKAEHIAKIASNLLSNWAVPTDEKKPIFDIVKKWGEDTQNPVLQRAFVEFVMDHVDSSYGDSVLEASRKDLVETALSPDNETFKQAHVRYLQSLEEVKEGEALWNILVKYHADKLPQELQGMSYIELVSQLQEPRRAVEWVTEVIKHVSEENRETEEKSEKVGPRAKSVESQRFFTTSREKLIQEMGSLVQAGKPWSEIFQKTIEWRKECAIRQLDPSWEEFGTARERTYYSNVKASNGEYLRDKINAYIQEDPSEEWVAAARVKRLGRAIYGKLPSGEQLELTRLVKSDYQINRLEYTMIFGNHEEGEPSYIWQHTSSENIKPAMQHIDALYKQALEAKSDEEVFNAVGRLHWWFCQACPCERGSAAIMEAVCLGVLRGKGINVEIKEGMLIDIEALSEPNEDTFVENYPTFFRHKE